MNMLDVPRPSWYDSAYKSMAEQVGERMRAVGAAWGIKSKTQCIICKYIYNYIYICNNAYNLNVYI